MVKTVGPDCLVAGGRVIDPRSGHDGVADIAIRAGRIAAVGRDLPRPPGFTVHDARGALVLPGLIDLHTHVYHKATSYGVDPDAVAERSLVTTLVDAGSAGAGTFAGLQDFVVARARTRLLAYINIAFPGIFAFDRRVMVGETAQRALLDVPSCVEVARAFADTVAGVKVRLGSAVSGALELQALDLALEAADALGLPLMCHVGRAPPTYAEICARLRRGDVLTHCFRPAPNTPLDDARRVLPVVAEARQRGVLFDIGHGMGSFGFDTVDAALAAGFLPDTVSSDVHALSIGGPAFDLLHTMNKLLNCGVPLPALVAMATDTPARAVCRDDLGHLGVGATADLSLLAERPVALRYVDSTGAQRDGYTLLVPLGMLRGGRWIDPPPRPFEAAAAAAAAEAATRPLEGRR